MLETQQRQMVEEFAQNIQQQGLSFDQYMQFTGMTAEAFMDQVKPQAEKRIQQRLVLEAIVKAENIEVSDEEIESVRIYATNSVTWSEEGINSLRYTKEVSGFPPGVYYVQITTRSASQTKKIIIL